MYFSKQNIAVFSYVTLPPSVEESVRESVSASVMYLSLITIICLNKKNRDLYVMNGTQHKGNQVNREESKKCKLTKQVIISL